MSPNIMDKFLAPHSPEAVAHFHLRENIAPWDADSTDEALVAGCAAYAAFDRYLSGQNLFILPRGRSELEHTLRRYAYDAIHNTVARSRSALAAGGYSRVCHQAEKSIRRVLDTADNTSVLLSLHTPALGPPDVHIQPCPGSAPIKI